MGNGRSKNWRIKNPDRGLIEEISKKRGITRLTSRILVNRGFVGWKEVDEFLSPSLSNLSDPMLMADVEKAAERVVSACLKDEKIMIYADYDVDGATGGSLLYLFLKEIFPDVDVSIHQNDRISDGYGMRRKYIEEAKRKNVGLIITVDCGISNFEEVEYAKSLGIDVIVTDHHTLKEGLPPAYAVLNPRRSDCGYRFKELAGVGVVFVLTCAIRKMMREKGVFERCGRPEPNLLKYLDLVALGTVADIVPLVGDNRIFVRYGLEQIRKNPRPGLKALMDAAGLRREFLSEVDLGFRIGPRINAAGRIGDSSLSSAILVEDSYQRALELARMLSSQNSKRQVEEEKILREAVEKIESEGWEDERLIVVAGEDWHVGVIGIVASRLVERYGLPTIVLSVDDRTAKGSARSLSEVNILRLISACSDLLEKFGGHAQAAGLELRRERVEDFTRKARELAKGLIAENDLTVSIDIDGEVPLNHLSERFFEELSLLSPFGHGNPEPVFLTRNLDLFGLTRKRNFTSFNVTQGDASFEVVCYSYSLEGEPPSRVDLVFTPRPGLAGGKARGKLFARDLRFT